MSREIMVPLDGTRFAEAALPAAIELAHRDGARLRLVTVWQPLPPPESDWIWDKERMAWQEDDRQRLETYLRDMATKVAERSGVAVEVDFLQGRVTDTLPRWVAGSHVDLTVMSTHGRGPVSRVWLGSIADRMVREGHHPVMVIHPQSRAPGAEAEPVAPFRRVLVPLDGSELSETALHRSLLVGDSGQEMELTLFRVIPFSNTSFPSYFPETTPLSEEVLADSKKAAQSYLLEVAGRLAGWARRVDTKAVTDLRVADAIVGFATEHEMDLIAMATHGRGGAARALLGSVADRVMRTSPIPVLLFPPRSVDAAPREEAAQGLASAERV